jgi:hypothetical protein
MGIMTNYRGQGSDSFSVGSTPPAVSWTVVRGDTSAFRVYVTDDNRNPLTISDWTIAMDIYRPSTDSVIVSLTPAQSDGDGEGEFTVSLTSGQSEILQTGDIFDIQLSMPSKVWTVAKGTMTIIEDVTN